MPTCQSNAVSYPGISKQQQHNTFRYVGSKLSTRLLAASIHKSLASGGLQDLTPSWTRQAGENRMPTCKTMAATQNKTVQRSGGMHSCPVTMLCLPHGWLWHPGCQECSADQCRVWCRFQSAFWGMCHESTTLSTLWALLCASSFVASHAFLRHLVTRVWPHTVSNNTSYKQQCVWRKCFIQATQHNGSLHHAHRRRPGSNGCASRIQCVTLFLTGTYLAGSFYQLPGGDWGAPMRPRPPQGADAEHRSRLREEHHGRGEVAVILCMETFRNF